MPFMQKDTKALTAKAQGSKTKRGKKAKKEAYKRSKSTEKRVAKKEKPIKVTPVKTPKKKVQKKAHDATSSEGEKNPLHKAEHHREIILLNCPFRTLEEDLKQVFPTAQRVIADRNHTGKCSVIFATRDEAVAASQQKDVTIKERIVHVYLYGDKKAIRSAEEALLITLEGCPSTTKEEDVRKAFPEGERVFLQRKYGQFTGTCSVAFVTSDKADAARQRTNVTIAGQAVTIKKSGGQQGRGQQGGGQQGGGQHEDSMKTTGGQHGACSATPKGQTSDDENFGREVVIRNCLSRIQEKDVKDIFPTAQKVRFSGTCFVQFSTRREAVEASKTIGLAINQKPVKLSLQGDNPKPAKRQKVA